MRNHLLAGIITAVALLGLQGCATTGSTTLTTDAASVTSIPAANPSFDHYIAWVPRDVAQTPTVARAMTHISLGNAREQAGKELCATSRLIDGQVIALVGPLPATAPASAGSYPAWYYRISQTPGLQGCSAIGHARLYRSLQQNLPDWISIRTAGTPDAGFLTLLE